VTDCTARAAPSCSKAANPATHRMVLRGRCQPGLFGAPQWVYLDRADVIVCEACVPKLIEDKPTGRAAIKIVADLQAKAIREGHVFDGAQYDYGFAEIDKPWYLVPVEMHQQLDKAAPRRTHEGRGDADAARKENKAGVSIRVVGKDKDGKDVDAVIAVQVNDRLDRQVAKLAGIVGQFEVRQP